MAASNPRTIFRLTKAVSYQNVSTQDDFVCGESTFYRKCNACELTLCLSVILDRVDQLLVICLVLQQTPFGSYL